MNRLLFIVARDQLDLWHHLKREFTQDAEVEVILDRRRGERRQRAQVRPHERRRADRRRKSGIDKDLRYRSFVIMHQPSGLSPDPSVEVPIPPLGGESFDDRVIQESMTKDERERAVADLMNEGYRMPPSRPELLAKVMEMRKREGGDAR